MRHGHDNATDLLDRLSPPASTAGLFSSPQDSVCSGEKALLLFYFNLVRQGRIISRIAQAS